MIKTLSGVLTGAFVLVTTVGFTAVSETSAREVATLLYGLSLLLAFAAGFVAIGGLGASYQRQTVNAWLCGLLALFWTSIQGGTAIMLVRLLPGVVWQGADNAHAWMIFAILSQATLLAIMARVDRAQSA